MFRTKICYYKTDCYLVRTAQAIYIQGSSCWFDSQKSHGTKSNGYSISMRIDGKFKSDFRDKLLKWLKVCCFECGYPITKKKINASPKQLLS